MLAALAFLFRSTRKLKEFIVNVAFPVRHCHRCSEDIG